MPGGLQSPVARFQFPEDYPSVAPHIQFLTTNSGKTRFNPNLYADGKVCLSILGTWRGESGEQWSSVQNCQVTAFPSPAQLVKLSKMDTTTHMSPFLCVTQSVMVSIQSLMDDKPYHNEPGFEKEGGGRRGHGAAADQVKSVLSRAFRCPARAAGKEQQNALNTA